MLCVLAFSLLLVHLSWTQISHSWLPCENEVEFQLLNSYARIGAKNTSFNPGTSTMTSKHLCELCGQLFFFIFVTFDWDFGVFPH